MSRNLTIKNWLVFYTKPRSEFKAESEMKAAGFEVYLPTITEIKNWSDRKKKITKPLFRSYIFAFCSEAERLKILKIEEIVTTVGIQGVPSIIPVQQIDAIKKLLEVATTIQVTEKILKDTPVRIIDGPFAGIEAIVQNQNSQTKISVVIETLNRTITAIIPIKLVEILKAV